jgi:RHS repeat-associated protein
LISAHLNGENITYAYRPDGMRASKSTADATVEHVWDGADIIADITDGAATRYVRGANLVLSSAGAAAAYYSYNAHGDVVQLTDGSGAVTKSYGYDAFGVEEAPDEGDGNPLRYCGEYLDLETNTYYLRARNYNTATGRFLSEDTHWNPGNMIYGDDPLQLNAYTYAPDIYSILQSNNLYAFCMNNPLMFFDSTGWAAVAIRDYTNSYGGTITWNEKTGAATFTISGITITTTVETIRRLADQGKTGYRELWKLLSQARFDK